MTDDGELDVCWSNFATVVIDVLNPLVMVFEAVGGDSNHLDIALGEVWGAARNLPKLSRADGGKISRMREQNSLKHINDETFYANTTYP